MVGSGLHGPDRMVNRGIAGHQNDLGRRGQGYYPLEDVKAVGIAEADIRNQDIRRFFRKTRHRLGCGDKAFHLVAILAQGLHKPPDRNDFIVQDIDADFLQCAFGHHRFFFQERHGGGRVFSNAPEAGIISPAKETWPD